MKWVKNRRASKLTENPVIVMGSGSVYEEIHIDDGYWR